MNSTFVSNGNSAHHTIMRGDSRAEDMVVVISNQGSMMSNYNPQIEINEANNSFKNKQKHKLSSLVQGIEISEICVPRKVGKLDSIPISTQTNGEGQDSSVLSRQNEFRKRDNISKESAFAFQRKPPAMQIISSPYTSQDQQRSPKKEQEKSKLQNNFGNVPYDRSINNSHESSCAERSRHASKLKTTSNWNQA